MALNKISDQMEMFGYTAEGAQQEADKFVDKDAAPAKDITFMDAAKFVAELTPVIGDAMAAKEVYDELQKDDPNYFLAGALGGATVIGLIPGIGDVAAKAIKKGARNFFDVAKRVEVDSNTLGTNLGNVNLKPKEPFKKTQSAYRIATQSEDGKLYPLFVNASDEIPVGQWVSATIPPITFKGANGNTYVPSKGAKRSKGEKAKPTGDMQALPDKETANNLKEAGFSVERPSKKYSFGRVRAVASRPGFHATTKPVAHHLGPEDLIVSSTERDKLLAAGITPKAFKSKTFNYLDGKLISKKQVANISEKDKKRVTSQKKYYVKRRAEDQVFIEVEMADDTSEDLIKYMQERGRKDIDDKLPSGGSYKYTEGQADAETWVIGGDMKVTRVLSREEAKSAQNAMGIKDLPHRDEVEKILGRKFYNGGLVGENMFTGQQDYLLSSDAMQMNEGGTAIKNTMQMNEGGAATDKQMVLAFMSDDVEVDPVSGNEVPPGSLPEEVRDDIPAQLSEGEYVVPADVLRFYGMKFFEDLRKNAKIELAQMEANGRIGGQPVDAAVGGYITGQPTQATMSDPYKQQQMMYRQGAPVAKGNAGYFPGGTVSLNPYGNPINNPFSNISSPTFNVGDPASNMANTNIKTNIPKPIIKDGMTYMPPSDFYVGSSLFGPAPSLQPPFTPVTLYGPNGEIVTANTQAEYDDYISQDYKTTQTITEEEPIVYESDNDDINQEVESLTTIAQQAESDAYAETFESALAGTASEQDYINIYNNLSTQQATLTGMSAINPIAGPVILKTLSDKKKINAALEKKYGADWKTNPKYADLAAKLKAIDDRSFTDKLKDAFTSEEETQGDTYTPEYSVYGLSMGGEMPTVEQLNTALGDGADLSGIVSTEGGGYVTLLSQQEQSAYDRAVKMGNGVAARHFAIINASRVKRLLDKGIKGLNEGEIEKLGLKKPKPIVPVVDPEDPVIVPEGGGNGGSSYNPMVFDDNDETYTPTSAQLNEQLEAAGQTNLTSDTSDVDFTQTSTGGDFVETGEDDSDPFEDIGIAANKGGLMSTSKKKKKNKK